MKKIEKYHYKFTLLGLLLTLIFIFQANAHANQGGATVHDNLFAAKACADADPFFCPGGVFDSALFDQMYQNPELFTNHYPSGGTGPYTRVNVPLCETANCGNDTIRCLDGTRPIYHYKPGSGTDANKWFIKIQSGGDTCSAENCATRYGTVDRDHFSSAYGQNSAMVNANGFLSTGPDNLYRNYNLVRFDKCVGDRNLGDVTVPDYTYAPGNTGPVYFHGYRIIQAVLQSLKDQAGAIPDLEDAETIVFLSHSNGSNGGYLYMDRLRQYVIDEIAAPANMPDVRYLASGYVFPGPEIEYALETGSFPTSYPDAYGHVDDQNTMSTICGNGFDPGNPFYQDWMDAGMNVSGPNQCLHGIGLDHLRGMGGMFFSTADFEFGRQYDLLDLWGAADATPTIDESCLAAHLSTGDVEACYDSTHVMLYHLTTPTFFAAQGADRNLRTTRLASLTVTFDPQYCDTGDPNCHTENYRGDTNGNGDPVPSEGGWQKEDYQERVLAIMEERFNGQSAHQEQPMGIGHGAFIDNTVDHMGLATMSKLRRTMIPAVGAEPFELQEYVWQWLDPTNQLQVVCVDDDALYDVEFAPPVSLPDAPPGLACASGAYYDPNIPIDPEQGCNDPFSNTASTSFACLVLPTYENFLPFAVSALP